MILKHLVDFIHIEIHHRYQHRKHAMSLILNDDYEGGELYLSEYNMKIKPKSNTAIIHQEYLLIKY